MKKLALLSAGILAFALQNGSAQTTSVLYTTMDDFTGSTPNTTEAVSAVSSWSYDSSTVNGLGNTSTPGGAGTSGSLSITWSGTGTFGQVAWIGQTPIYSIPYMAALMPGSIPAYQPPTYPGGTTVAGSGVLQMIYTVPDNEGGTYFQLGIDLAYPNDYYSQFFASTTTDLGFDSTIGEEVMQATIPYTIKNGPANSLFSLGFAILYNSDYSPVLPFYVDQIQIVPEPSTMALMGLGTLGFAFLARRRRA